MPTPSIFDTLSRWCGPPCISGSSSPKRLTRQTFLGCCIRRKKEDLKIRAISSHLHLVKAFMPRMIYALTDVISLPVDHLSMGKRSADVDDGARLPRHIAAAEPPVTGQRHCANANASVPFDNGARSRRFCISLARSLQDSGCRNILKEARSCGEP